MSGHLSMGSVLRNNRNLLQKYKKKVLKKPFKGREGEIALKEISEEELQLFRAKIAKERKRENRKTFVISAIILIPVIWIMYSYFNTFIQYKNKESQLIELQKLKEIEKENKETVTSERYLIQINRGDKWLENKNWKNAIYFYSNAVDLHPEKFEANYRLVLAYSYRCKYENLDCEIGKKYNDRLLKYFPEDERLLKLECIFEKE